MHRFSLIVFILLIGFSCVVVSLWHATAAAEQGKEQRSTDTAVTVNGLRVLLFVPDKYWNRNADLPIYVALYNVSKSPMTLDRRLDIGTSVKLTIGNKKGTVNYTPFGVTVARPDKGDLIVLKPGEFIGRRFVVSRAKVYKVETRHAIDRMPPGSAKMRVIYTTLDIVRQRTSGTTPWWLGKVTSNEVDIAVK